MVYLNFFLGILTLIVVLLVIGKYRYENGISKFSKK